MNKEEAREFIRELVNEPEICCVCGRGIIRRTRGDTGYTIKTCDRCGYSISEE